MSHVTDDRCSVRWSIFRKLAIGTFTCCVVALAGADRTWAQCDACGSNDGILSRLLGHSAARNPPTLQQGTLSDVMAPQRCGYRAPRYPVPYATPPVVGSTTFTYPPMMPHHSLPHYRPYYSYRHAPGLARTNVAWTHTPGDLWRRMAYQFELPR